MMRRRRTTKKTAIERAKEWGIDLSLLEENLRLTPTERLEKMISYQRFVERIQAEMQKKNRIASNRH
jgi:hypothetical protein